MVSVLLALWSASGGVGNLRTAINLAYDEDEGRGFVKPQGLALLMTVGAIAFFGVAIGVLAVFPAVVSDQPRLRWTSYGAAVATVIWIRASVGFSLCATHPS